jgi:hypothetical protein
MQVDQQMGCAFQMHDHLRTSIASFRTMKKQRHILVVIRNDFLTGEQTHRHRTISELLPQPLLRNEALFLVHLGASSGVLAEIAAIILAPFRESAGDWILPFRKSEVNEAIA